MSVPTLTYYRLTSCCDGTVWNLRYETGPNGIIFANGKYKYGGLDIVKDSTTGPVELLRGQCYEIEILTDEAPIVQAYDTLPDTIFFQYVSTDCLTKPTSSGLGDIVLNCDDCPSPCYRLINCDGSFIFTITDLSAELGTFVTIEDLAGCYYVALEPNCLNVTTVVNVTGTCSDCECGCYEIIGNTSVNYVGCDDVYYENVTAPARFCAKTTPTFNSKPDPATDNIISSGTCTDGECPPKCYYLTNCKPEDWPLQESNLHSTSPGLFIYANSGEIVELDGYDGCWTVQDWSCNCIEVTIDSAVNPGANTYTANQQGQYNGYNYYTFTWTEVATEYNIWFDSATGSWVISAVLGVRGLAGGELVDAKAPNPPCPVGLTWDVTGVIPITTLTTALCAEQCDCPVDVTVTQSHEDCETCVGVTAYKLTSCDSNDEILYTTQDLSDYKDRVVELDDECGCYIVEEINITPPSDTEVTIIAGFDNCTDCQTKFYKLISCDEADPDTYTSEDLSEQIGNVIQIQGCDKCFTVEETREPINPIGLTFKSSYENCADCLKDFPCRCSTIYNDSDKEATFTYIDCEGVVQTTDIVQPKSRSKRYCVIRWLDGDYSLYHGNCTDGTEGTWTCPSKTYPVKKIKPGYNTPVCSIEKYEKISCNFGEQLYKLVLEKRYGISNCCPEEIDKWTVKKELIELKALIDPEYDCSDNCSPTPVPPPACDTHVIVSGAKLQDVTYTPCGETEEVTINPVALYTVICVEPDTEVTGTAGTTIVGQNCENLSCISWTVTSNDINQDLTYVPCGETNPITLLNVASGTVICADINTAPTGSADLSTTGETCE